MPEYDQTVDGFESSAKHLEGDEKLMSLAGSLGYVAPGKNSPVLRKIVIFDATEEVLSQLGHGKPVDIWSVGFVISSLSFAGGAQDLQ